MHIPPSDLAGFFARCIGDQHEEPWLDILLGGSEAVGHNPEQRKAVEMTGINLLHMEIERLFGAYGNVRPCMLIILLICGVLNVL